MSRNRFLQTNTGLTQNQIDDVSVRLSPLENKTDFITVTQAVNLDSIELQQASNTTNIGTKVSKTGHTANRLIVTSASGVLETSSDVSVAQLSTAISDIATNTSSISNTAVLDEDDMASNNPLRPPSQQSVKVYVEGKTDAVPTNTSNITAIGNGLLTAEGTIVTHTNNIATNLGNINSNDSDITAIKLKTDYISVSQAVDLDTIETQAGNSLQFGDVITPMGDITVGGGQGSYASEFKFRGNGLVGGTIYHATMKLPNVLGADITLTLPAATGSLQVEPSEGAFANGDKTKLNGIETYATADQSDAEIRALVASATDSNVFTDTYRDNIIDHTSTIADLVGDVAANTLQHTNTSYVVGQQVIEQAFMKLKTDRLTVTQAVNLDTMESNIVTNNAKNGISGTQTSNILANNAKNGISGTQATQLSTLNSHFGTSYTYSNWRIRNGAMGCFGSTINTATSTGSSSNAYLFLDTRDGSLPGNAGYVYPVLKTNFTNLYFAVRNVYAGYLQNVNVNNIDFTGQHQALPVDEVLFNNIDDYVGRIVISNGDVSSIVKDASDNYCIKTGKGGITINESIPRVVLCNTYKDKRVFGVISPEEEEENIKSMPNRSTEKHFSQGIFVSVVTGMPEDDNRLIINALGEGAIWVINSHGNITNGDYICSSDKGEGFGCLQDDDFLHNYTCAKATIDCSFDLASNDYECKEILVNGENLKIAFIACTYSF